MMKVEVVYTVKGEIGPSRSHLEVPDGASRDDVLKILNEKLAPKKVRELVSIVQVD